MKKLFGIRGAVCAENSKESISKASVDMCTLLFEKNSLSTDDIVSIHFTLTEDLDEMNPCAALRNNYKGIIDVSKTPLFCTQEARIKGSLSKVIRVLVTAYMEDISEPSHVYIGGAEILRTDLKR